MVGRAVGQRAARPWHWRALVGTAGAALVAFTVLALLHVPVLALGAVPLTYLLVRGAAAPGLLHAAHTDAKTHLLRSGVWLDVARRELARAVREESAGAVVLVDIDRFKEFNERHGHLGGDIALSAVAGALKDELRGYDVVGRFGGEEFVVLLPNTDSAGARAAAERVRSRIAATTIDVPAPRPPSVTVSLGVAMYPEHGSDIEALLTRADTALYAAKRSGRNRVVVATAASSLGT